MERILSNQHLEKRWLVYRIFLNTVFFCCLSVTSFCLQANEVRFSCNMEGRLSEGYKGRLKIDIGPKLLEWGSSRFQISHQSDQHITAYKLEEFGGGSIFIIDRVTGDYTYYRGSLACVEGTSCNERFPIHQALAGACKRALF